MQRNLSVFLLFSLCACKDKNGADDTGTDAMADTLFVGLDGSIVSYDIASWEQNSGAIADADTPTDLYALTDGHLLVHFTGRNEVAAIDGRTMTEVGRWDSSGMGATRPIHAYISPEIEGEQYWFAQNDGDGTAATSSVQIIDVMPSSDTFLEVLGEVGLGAGHHTAGFSSDSQRGIFGSLGDCDMALVVVDFSDATSPSAAHAITAEDLGFDGSSFSTTCDPTYAEGLPVSPNGCATATESGNTYCNISTPGDIVALDLDTPETWTTIATSGSDGGYTEVHPEGRYIYSVQGIPREGDENNPGATCQVGQIVTIDASTDTVVSEVPMLLDGPDCTKSIVGTDEETSEPNKIVIDHEGSRLYVTLAGGFGVTDARIRALPVYDLSDPAAPVQLDSIPTGESTGFLGSTLSGDEKWYFVTDNIDNTITVIDTATLEVDKTLAVDGTPKTVASYGDAEGPSHQHGPLH